MALFGKKKDPTLLVQEGTKYAGLIQDWLKEPLGALRNASNKDKVLAEHYMLAICGYIAWEKISPDARKYFHHALADTSIYCREYAQDKAKEANTLAVILGVLEDAERDARKRRRNVLEAMVSSLFGDFSKYNDPVLVKYVVYTTLNRFNEEIPTTNYANLRLPVPPAPAAARPSYSAPATPARPAPAPAKPAPAPAPARKAPYMAYDRNNNPIYLDTVGGLLVYNNRAYQAVINREKQEEMAFLDVTDGSVVFVRDRALMDELTRMLIQKLS